MTATIEDQVRQVKQESIAAFVMPRPCRGQTVTWYPDGRPTNGEMAHALEIGRRNIVVQRASGRCMETVYHVADPKLDLSADIRENGAWDFTEQDKERTADRARMAALESRLAALESVFNEPAKKGK